MWRTSSAPVRLAMAAPTARPAARTTPRARRRRRSSCRRGPRRGIEAPRRARMIAGALATVSRQPNRPQWHAAPSGSTTTWPISPAASPSPPNSWPLEDQAGTDAATDLDDRRGSAGRSSPSNRYVAKAAARLSLATTVGRPWRSWRIAARGRSCQSRLTAQRIVPSASTMPGVPTPMPRIGLVASARTSSMSSWTRARAASPSRPSRSRRPAWSSARRGGSARAAVKVRSPRSRTMTVRASSLSATRVGCLPPVLGPRPTSRGQAVALEVRDELADARPGQAGEAGDVGAADRAEVVERAQDEAALWARVCAWVALPGIRCVRSPDAGFAPLQACRANMPTTSSGDLTKRILARARLCQ